MSQTSENGYTQPLRQNFTEDEKRFPWLSLLLDAYLIIDEGVSEAIRREQKQGHPLACAKGCSSCCSSHQDIPVYPLELMGMSWYIIEKLQPPLRQQLKQQLKNLDTVNSCPFLLDSACSIHPMRPIACRQFNVLNKPCAEGEDAFHTRRNDVITPIKRYADEAFDIMLPFYGIKKKAERRKAIKQGAIHSAAKVMRDCNWQSMPEKMSAFDKR
ncbi:MAG: YkgJ family cysteine cluster protein [Gammaproteobacteria bacterium]|nr:YkgJ family cysteine cluster protein [Gammaproteobacteria bacterium]